MDRIPKTGWLAIDPLPTSICWVEQASLELDDDDPRGSSSNGRSIQVQKDPGATTRAWVIRPRAVVRSGNLLARLPGPPAGPCPTVRWSTSSTGPS